MANQVGVQVTRSVAGPLSFGADPGDTFFIALLADKGPINVPTLITSKTGGEEQNEVTQVRPGGGGDPVNIEGPTTVGQITLQKPYDLILDGPLNLWSRAWSQGIKRPLTLIVQPVTSQGIPAGEPDTYVGCSRVSFKHPDVETDSASPAMLEISVQPTARK